MKNIFSPFFMKESRGNVDSARRRLWSLSHLYLDYLRTYFFGNCWFFLVRLGRVYCADTNVFILFSLLCRFINSWCTICFDTCQMACSIEPIYRYISHLSLETIAGRGLGKQHLVRDSDHEL